MKFWKLELVEEWQHAWKLYSMWIFALIAVAPQLYDLAVQYHIVVAGAVPDLFGRIINIIGFVGAASRIVKQQKIAAKLEKAAEKAQDSAA